MPILTAAEAEAAQTKSNDTFTYGRHRYLCHTRRQHRTLWVVISAADEEQAKERYRDLVRLGPTDVIEVERA